MAASKSFSIGESFSFAWSKWQLNVGPFLGLQAVSIVIQIIPLFGQIAAFYFHAAQVLTALYSAAERKVTIKESLPSMSMFGGYFLGIFLLGLASLVMGAIAAMLISLVMLVGLPSDIGYLISAVTASIIYAVIFCLYLRICFWPFVLFHREAGFMEAIKGSWELTEGAPLLTLIAYAIACIAIIFLGFLAFFVGIFIASPIVYVSMAYVYRKLLEQTPSLMSTSQQPTPMSTPSPIAATPVAPEMAPPAQTPAA